MNPDDPRAQRTRARLQAAILDLATERDLAEITIAEVAKRAAVNRATVYLHYADVDALAAAAMRDAVAEVARAAALCPLTAPRDRAPEPLTTLFAHVEANLKLYGCMLGPQGSPRFTAGLRERLTAELETRFARGSRPPGADDVPVEVHAAYLAGALTGVIAHWATGGSAAVPADQVALAFWRLFRT